MSNYMTLVGAEDVSRAGYRVADAADTMRSAAGSFDSSADRLVTNFVHLVERFELAVEKLAATLQTSTSKKE